MVRTMEFVLLNPYLILCHGCAQSKDKFLPVGTFNDFEFCGTVVSSVPFKIHAMKYLHPNEGWDIHDAVYS